MLKSGAANAQRRAAEGKALRAQTPRAAHAQWAPAADRADPLELIEASARGRLADLLPIRHSRMNESAFSFFRGSAVVMASDLARTPSTGLVVQADGDAHCLNFGGFATPERNIIFDLNDFDETLPGPWEWDVKRLVTSIMLAGRDNGLRDRANAVATLSAAQAYAHAHARPRYDARTGRLVRAAGCVRNPRRRDRPARSPTAQSHRRACGDGADPLGRRQAHARARRRVALSRGSAGAVSFERDGP